MQISDLFQWQLNLRPLTHNNRSHSSSNWNKFTHLIILKIKNTCLTHYTINFLMYVTLLLRDLNKLTLSWIEVQQRLWKKLLKSINMKINQHFYLFKIRIYVHIFTEQLNVDLCWRMYVKCRFEDTEISFFYSCVILRIISLFAFDFCNISNLVKLMSFNELVSVIYWLELHR